MEGKEFSIPTDLSWNKFQSLGSMYLGGLGRMVQMCCRMSIRGGLVALRGNNDWVNLMVSVRQCCAAGLYKEFEIMDVSSLLGDSGNHGLNPHQCQVEIGAYPSNDQHQIRLLQLDQYPGLSDHRLDMETFPFNYPSIQELLSHLDTLQAGGTHHQYESYLPTLHSSRMKYVDDLTMISEQDLYVASGIPPGRIHSLYARARVMMLAVYMMNKEAILEMNELKREWREGKARIHI